MKKLMYSKGNIVPWLVVTIVILVIIFFVVRNNRMKENKDMIPLDQTAETTTEDTTLTNPPVPTSSTSVDQDMASIDSNLSIISSDDKDINSGINDTPIAQN
jgi:flagellar biosynthesis/type III secretory pathway M-ring protein FliF/YscJ